MSHPSPTTASESRGMHETTAPNRSILTGFFAPLRKRNFCLLVGGQAISTMGDMFYAVALPWYMLTSGQGIQALSAMLTAYGIPRIACLLLGGVLSDRWHPRRVMLLSDVARALLVGVLVVLVLSGHPAFWQLCTVAALLGGFTGLFTPASFAILPELLPDQDLQSGNALNFSAIQLALSLSPALAGLIISRFVPSIAFGLDVISFGISALTLFMMRKPFLSSEGGSFGKDTASISATPVSTDVITDEAPVAKQTLWQFMKSSRLLQITLLIIIVINVTNGGMMQVALPVLAKDSFRGGASGFGFMLAAFGFGALLGSIAAGGLSQIKHRCMTALLLALLQIAVFAVLPFTGQIVWAVPVLVIAGIANGLVDVLFFTLLQQYVPRYLLGSVMAAFLMASLGVYPLSIILGGFVTLQFGPMLMFPLGLVLGLPAVIFGLSQRELWEI
ncbi:MAG: MFS transporter [Ktedonobacteraceae bacterium]